MQPLIWLGILAVLLVIEAITAGLTTIWFAGGALIAAIASYVGAGVMAQILLFLCISLVLLIFTRPVAMKYFNKETIQTNANSLIGKKAVVIQDIDNLAQTGQVRINDIEWTARTADDSQKIGKGAVVLSDSYYRHCRMGACILCPYCAAGICSDPGTAGSLSGYLEHWYPFQSAIY